MNTFINKVRKEAQTNKERVLSLLQWTDLEYGQFQEEMGYAYLRYEFGDDTLFVDELPYTKEFWAWWKNHWNRRDTIFLMDSSSLDLSERITLYSQLHNPEVFEFHPHRKVLEKSYSNMIDKVIKQAVL